MAGTEVEFARNTRSAYIGGVVWLLIGLFTISSVTWSALRDLGSAGAGWTWVRLAIADLMVLSIFGGLLFQVWANLQVRFTDIEVSKPGFLKRKVIPWSEVVRFESRAGIRISSAKERISFSPFVFKEPEKLHTFLEQRLRHLRER
jgi:hypothetical protein